MADLRARAQGELVWLPPGLAGLTLLTKLRLLRTIPSARPAPPLATTTAALLSSLTHREREVAELIAAGTHYSKIAARLYITESTVKSHVASAKIKLGVGGRENLGLAYRKLQEG